MGINRTTQSLLAAVVVLAAAFGIAELDQPTASSSTEQAGAGAPLRTQVQTTDLVCPPPQGSSGSTDYTVAAPGPTTDGSSAPSSAAGNSAALSALSQPGATAQPAKPLASLTNPGSLASAKPSGGSPAALVANGSGTLAPGLTVQQTTSSSQAVTGALCTAPATDFWFAGTSAAKGRSDTLLLTNTEDQPAAVSVQLFGPGGEADNPDAANLTVQPGATLATPVAKLVNGGIDGSDLAAHVIVHNGRVAASLYGDDGSNGADWLPATSTGSSLTIPGLPGDTADAKLLVAAPGDQDADLKLQLASQTGWITPAGHETVHVSSGSATVVDLGAVTHGQPAALRLTPSGASGSVPVVAGIQVTRAHDETFLSGTAPIITRATASGSNGSDSTLLLSAGGSAATVKINAFAASGSPATKTVQIPAGTTISVPAPQPSGSGPYALTLTPSTSDVYAARLLTRPGGLFTIQPLPDDHSTVEVPHPIPNPAAPLN